MLARMKPPKAKKPPEPMTGIGMRLQRKDKELLEAIAQEEGRSFSNLMQRMVDEFLRQRGVK